MEGNPTRVTDTFDLNRMIEMKLNGKESQAKS